MRSPRNVLLALTAVAAAAACRDDEITTASRPPLAGVRYINALADTGRVDIKMVDQLAYSANTNEGVGGITYRTGTRYYSTEAKARRIRVFAFQDSSAATVSSVIHDTTLTFDADRNYTLLLTGSARARTARFRLIDDSQVPTPAAGRIAVRVYNAGAGAVDAYLTETTTSAIAGATSILGTADFAASPYVARDTAALAVRVTAAGSTTVLASTLAGAGTLGTSLLNPVAGSRVAGTVFSAYVFPRAVAGSGALAGQSAANVTALSTTGVVLFVDRLPPTTVATP
jgi:hypothetical protein